MKFVQLENLPVTYLKRESTSSQSMRIDSAVAIRYLAGFECTLVFYDTC